MQRVARRIFELGEVQVEGAGPFRLGVDEECPGANDRGCLSGPQHGVLDERRAQSLTKREQEDAERAKQARKKTSRRGGGRSLAEEDDEVEAYDDLLRRLKR